MKWLRGWLCALALLVLAPAVYGSDWQRISNEDGVTVDTRDVPGESLPVFRGITTVSANIYEVAAVIDDIDGACLWTKRCVASREVQRISETERIFYNRTSAPWPVQDRDAVLRGHVSGLEEGKDISIRFENATHATLPAQSGAVRMPRVVGFYRLVRQGPRATRVEFQVEAHLGGLIPDWIARISSRNIPHDTLVGLSHFVPKARARYKPFLQAHAPELYEDAAPATR